MLDDPLRRIWGGVVCLVVICASFTRLTPATHVAYAAAYDHDASTRTANTPLRAVAQDTEPPSTPETLTAVAYPGYILVDWYASNDDTGIANYLIL